MPDLSTLVVTVAMSNPDWTRDELILLIELYHRLEGKHISPKSPAVVDLSHLLNELPIHSPSLRDHKFRNADGVAMKLRNLQRLDPQSVAAGLGRGGRLEAIVWDEFRADQPALMNTARAIRACYRDLLVHRAPHFRATDLPDRYEEGAILARVHVSRERNVTVVRRKKLEAVRRSGCLTCEICGFDFCRAYGALGDGYAECHHTVPLAMLDHRRATRLLDLAIVCANCHRMLHRGSAWVSVDELRVIVQGQQSAVTVGHNSRHRPHC